MSQGTGLNDILWDMFNQGTLLFPAAALSVTDVNRQVKDLLEQDLILEDLWVQGEVSNLSTPASGHAYFTLKDEKSSLKCVIWRSSLTGTARSALQNGSAVEAHGKIGVYERDGIYQLYADKVRPVGQGRLFEEFLRLKEKLEKEGLFDPARKRALPSMPRRIGIVTSPSGAALQDMLNTIRNRWPLAEVLIAPAAVQGATAPAELTEAFDRLEQKRPDVILIGRGGGSLEDLWAFNDEQLVRRIAASAVPVVSGVGHETDFSLVDFAADLRAPTPTGAAVLATPDIRNIRGDIDGFTAKMEKILRERIRASRQALDGLVRRLDHQAPLNRIRQQRLTIDQWSLRLNQWMAARMDRERLMVNGLDQRLAALNPETILKRGYALVEREGEIITSAAQLQPDEMIRIRMADGSVDASVR